MDLKSISNLNINNLLTKFSSSLSGLKQEQVAGLQKSYGKNVFKTSNHSAFRILLRQFNSYFIYLLILSTCILFLLKNYTEAITITIFIIINTIIGFYQEYKSEKIFSYLKEYLKIKCVVIRDNQQQIIDSEDLVPGDIIFLEAGDIIPADVRFLEIQNLSINESSITGESLPATKTTDIADIDDQVNNIGFASTIIDTGNAKALVVRTGKDTMLKEVSTLSTQISRQSNFSQQINNFSKVIVKIVLLIIIVVFLANVIIKAGNVNIIELFIFSVALAIAITPEPLPLITIVSLTQAAYNLSKSKVIVKRLSAIEDLGAINILCTDKTGTLTENILEVSNIFNNSDDSILKALLASSTFTSKQKIELNPFDDAIWSKLNKINIFDYKLLQSISFDPLRLRTSSLVEYKNGNKQIIVRGAFEAIKNLCKDMPASLEPWIETEESEGKRVLVTAYKTYNGNTFKESDENNLDFAEAISFSDPIKKTVIDAIKQANALDVKIKILTGDSATVATNVASSLGLIKSKEEVITGKDFDNLNENEQLNAVSKYTIFARVNPLQKFKIITLLQTNNKVGYLGDGINDAPALKIANVGIVVQNASYVAKEASDIILLKKSLSAIIYGIYYGRTIFANTVKYIKITLASNFGNFFSVSIASFFIDFLPMLPTQILLVNLLSDLPMVSISTDNVDIKELKQPKQFDLKDIIKTSVLLGAVSSIFDFIMFKKYYKDQPSVLQTNWFIFSILTEIALIFSLRTQQFFLKAKHPSFVLVLLSIVCSAIAIIIPLTKLGDSLFGLISLQPTFIWFIILLTLCYFITTEIAKLIYYRIKNRL